MELRLHSQPIAHRAPDWTAAAVSGLAAGAILMVLELFWAATEIGASPWTTSHLIAAIVLGPGVAQSASFSIGVVATALVIHYILGIGFGLMLGMILAEWRLDVSLGTAQITGALFGLLMYFINFYGIAYAFPWFLEMRGWATLIAHLVLGLTAAGLYWKLEREDRAA